MAEITANKPINVYQLGQEVGGNPALRCVGPDATGCTKVRTDSVSQQVLETKVAAHTANPSIVPPPSAEDLRQVEVNEAGARLKQSYTSLRQWAQDAKSVGAQGANVSQAQHKQLFDRFGKLCDGLADLLVWLRNDR